MFLPFVSTYEIHDFSAKYFIPTMSHTDSILIMSVCDILNVNMIVKCLTEPVDKLHYCDKADSSDDTPESPEASYEAHPAVWSQPHICHCIVLIHNH